MTATVRLVCLWCAAIALGAMLVPCGAVAAAQDMGTPTAASPATAIVYLTIANAGEFDDVLVSAETGAADTVELHESVEDDGVVRMEPRPGGIAIPAGADTAFDAGGLHVMLVGLTADLRAGEAYDLALRFETAGEVTVPVQVRFSDEPDDDEPAPEPVEAGELTISDAWSRPAPALLGVATLGAGEEPGLDTPVVAGGLTVVLTADGTAAGPRDLTVLLTDEAGDPVTDATVTTSTSSLVMDHGVSTRETEQVEPGRYLVGNVPMGMGGDWNVEIAISRSGEDPVVVIFVVTLDGP